VQSVLVDRQTSFSTLRLLCWSWYRYRVSVACVSRGAVGATRISADSRHEHRPSEVSLHAECIIVVLMKVYRDVGHSSAALTSRQLSRKRNVWCEVYRDVGHSSSMTHRQATSRKANAQTNQQIRRAG
jgi:hypothetical protein